MTPDQGRDRRPMGPPGDDELGRLIADGLAHRLAGPVDEHALVAGARAGAGRIRRRRSVGAALAALVVLALPAALFGPRLLGTVHSTSSEAGEPAAAAGSAAAHGPMSAAAGESDAGSGSASAEGGSALAAGSAPTDAAGVGDARLSPAPAAGKAPSAHSVMPTASPAPATAVPLLTPAPLARTAAGAVAVPAEALLGAPDLRAVTTVPLAATSDTRNAGPAPAVAAADVCGRAPSGLPAPAGSRAVTFERAGGTASGWLIGSTVRVFAGTSATRYLAALTAQQGCLARVEVAGADAAMAGHGAADRLGRTPWFAVAVTGRTVTEVRLVVPKGSGVGPAQVQALLATAAGRLGSSGLAAAALADPSLG